ncbi:hypothetical protein BDC45DRAFT_519597 [Circinella umbellata]|nr:hypothetical protein BDC45DRAFT_519597 [Circinella umbellata]
MFFFLLFVYYHPIRSPPNKKKSINFFFFYQWFNINMSITTFLNVFFKGRRVKNKLLLLYY